jgi:hypothetical protein
MPLIPFESGVLGACIHCRRPLVQRGSFLVTQELPEVPGLIMPSDCSARPEGERRWGPHELPPPR